MKILITVDPELPVPPLRYGGIERIVHSLVSEIVRKGDHQVGLVAHPESTTAADQFFPWIGAKSQRPLDTAANTVTLGKAVWRFKPDVVHSFSRLLYLTPVLLRGFPKIMSYQRRPGARQVRWASKLSGNSLTFSGCSEHICEVGRAAGGEWHAIHNFIDVAKYTYRDDVGDSAPLVFLSRVERIKGAHLAIRVARATGRRLLIAGNHASSGKEGEYWATEIEPNLGHDIEYVGEVDDVQKNVLLGQAAAMIVPIEWEEPFGIVFAESLACGTPVISCPRGALPEIVRHGVDGYLVNNFSEACKAVESLNAIRRQDCRERAEQAFSVSAIVPKYDSLYRAVAGGKT